MNIGSALSQIFTTDSDQNNPILRQLEQALGLLPISTDVSVIWEIVSRIYYNNYFQ